MGELIAVVDQTGMADADDFTAQFARYPGDGDNWGTFEFYNDFRALLRRALAAARPFDTGWLGVKKSPLSFRIRCTPDGNGNWRARCQVSVTDDFDTPGEGDTSCTWAMLTPDQALEELRTALRAARAAAAADKAQNEEYVGFSVGYATPEGGRQDWIYTLLLPRDGDTDVDAPPGDSYDHWGWEDLGPSDVLGETSWPQAAPAATDPFTAELRAACLVWAEAYVRGEADGERLRAGPFCIEPWGSE